MTTLRLSALLILLCTPLLSFAKTFSEHTAGTQPLEGFVDLYWNRSSGKLLMAVEELETEFIYQSSMPQGIGSNDLGLDRGQLGSTRMVEFIRSGPKLLMVQKNLDYRASSDNKLEREAVESSFARSVVWGFEILAEDGDRLLVDGTEFFLRDAHGISTWLSRSQQGNYRVDGSRSAIFMDRTRAFPDNTEVEGIITYTGNQKTDGAGGIASGTLATVVPDVTAVTVHLHHSFIRTPEDGYEPLPFDPRSGIINSSHLDYSSEIGTPLVTRQGWRHRLERVDPAAPMSEAVEPIVYYVDSGAPEPIRSALIEGASWWNEAFEAAGYINAFQVKILPEGADPMDVRYNVIQWVHRSTRGWSYGSSVRDPRTGEILKGHVTLGSLRVRQDYMIAEGLLAPYEDDTVNPVMLEMSLARIRQLSAHEVGHTIGIAHNFAGSVNDRSTVMDYPFPLIQFGANGGLDLSEAYGVGIGEWDKRTIDYAYRDFPNDANAEAGRQDILRRTREDGLLFVADQDSRNVGTAHPHGNLWDNGEDAIDELEHLLKVRGWALNRFSPAVLRPGTPLALMEETLVPIYLLHRFQLQAVGKLLGGIDFRYNLRGDGQPTPLAVTPDRQREALSALLVTLDPATLAVPTPIIDMIPPRPPGFARGRETFARSTGTSFDPLAPPLASASLTMDVLLHPARAARLNQQQLANGDQPDFGEVLDSITRTTWYSNRQGGMNGAIQRKLANHYLDRLLALQSGRGQTSSQARAQIRDLEAWLEKERRSRMSRTWSDHYAAALEAISDIDRAGWKAPALDVQVPPGSPIGG